MDRGGKSVEISCYLFGIVIHSSSNYEAKREMPCVSVVSRGKKKAQALNWLVRNRLFQVVITMSDVWRIFVVEGEETLNHNIVNSLRKDGYIVQGVMNGADAVHILWSEEYDVVLCDLKAPGANGFELLQWLRASHPNTRMILIGTPDSSAMRMQALEAGAAGYLEKPLDLHLLKEELRRLLQQTGFSANLDSFDLLDVIQIITMSRKSIALLVNTGLEERGLLCFKGGDLVWAEYGILRGEEAFFALAAHKNGTVTQQPWNEQVTANVTQPLSRLIFQALQYRTKYANQQPYSGEQSPILDELQFSDESVLSNALLMEGEEDDTPFGVLGNSLPLDVPFASSGRQQEANLSTIDATREWWERSGAISALNSEDGISVASQPLPASIEAAPTMAVDGHSLADSTMTPPVYKAVGGQHNDLPSWLTDQPTAANQKIRSSALSGSAPIPVVRPSSPEWQPPQPTNGNAALRSGLSGGMRPITAPPQQATGGNRQLRQATGTQKPLSSAQNPPTTDAGTRRARVAEWQIPESTIHNIPIPGGNVQMPPLPGISGSMDLSTTKEESGASPAVRLNYNYSALVSALQSLGYSIPGFIATALMDRDGQSIAQVAVDELDISRICKHFSTIIKGTLQSLDQGMWGDYKDTVITSSDRHILMRMIGNERSTFQVLITTHEAKPAESLEVMTNIESAINAALRS
jgi:DNA-binding response OmpR family regulator/predicted regulator of Ras-like GTPase activity (Roadblock/LC7/MglB family)